MWHGARGTFLLFGVIHGLWYVLETEMKASKIWRKWAKGRSEQSVRRLGQAVTMLPLMLTFALFASPDLGSFWLVVKSLLGAAGGVPSAAAAAVAAVDARSYGVLALGFLLVWLAPNSIELLSRYRPGVSSWVNPSTTPAFLTPRWRPSLPWGAFLISILGASLASMAYKAPFLYQGF